MLILHAAEPNLALAHGHCNPGGTVKHAGRATSGILLDSDRDRWWVTESPDIATFVPQELGRGQAAPVGMHMPASRRRAGMPRSLGGVHMKTGKPLWHSSLAEEARHCIHKCCPPPVQELGRSL